MQNSYLAFLSTPFKSFNLQKLYFVFILFALLGFSGGYYELSNGVPFMAKLGTAILGALISLGIGYVFLLKLCLWNVENRVKWRVIIIFLFGMLAPCSFCYFDFEEYSKSTFGLKLFLIINLICTISLLFITKRKEFDFLGSLSFLLLWEFIVFFWFVCVTWQFMDYWD